MTTVKLTILEGHSFSAWSDEYARGERPSRLPYGLEQLSSPSVEVLHSDLTHSEGRVANMLRKADPRLAYGLRYRGALGQVITSLPLVLRSDACVSIFEHHANVYRRLQTIGSQRLPPLVLISCYLAQWLRSSDTSLRATAQLVARAASAITVFSSNQVDIVVEEAGVPPERIDVIPYGIDTEFYRPAPTGPADPPYVVAAGRDEGRDWSTFLAAARNTPGIPYRLATAPWMLEGLELPPNVEFVGEVDHLGYRELLRQAEFAVVPTYEFAYPTGQSVLLEALACGRPVVVTHTAAMADYLNPAVLATPPGDANQLAGAIAGLWDDRDGRVSMSRLARDTAREHYSTAVLWQAALPSILRGAGERRR